ncbi:MAG: phage terminase large subunit family protein, partial [Ardenticatenia bacterium]|nr:phage terminase large subunit family protein [Ardenticatenia bacterium]
MPLLRLLTRSMVEQARSDLASGSLLGWMFAARSLLAEGVPFDLGRHLYLKDIYKDTAPEMIVMKSGQAGVSEYCVSRALWSCDRRGMNVLYLLPTLGDIGDFSQMRIGTAIEASAYLRDVVIEGRQDGKRGSDRVMLKRVRDRWLVLRGTQVKLGAAQRERRPGA